MNLDTIELGDAYELIKEVPDKSVDLVVTDPPYQISGLHKDYGILKNRKNSHSRDLLENNLSVGIDLSILDEFVRVMKKINIYLWCNKEQIYDYITYFVKEKNCNFEILVWAKDAPIPFCGIHYLVDKEYCLFFWETGAKIEIPFERGKTVYFTAKNIADKKDYGHPTIKPLEIIRNLIKNSTCDGGIVLDPFIGSGTTAVACKELDRHYIGFELNPKYYQIAIDRLNGITKEDREALDKGQLTLF